MSALPADIKPAPHGDSGRTLSTFTRDDKTRSKRLLEWSTAAPSHLEALIERVKHRIPTTADFHRAEEARTPQIDGFLIDGPRTVMVYKCDGKPTSLYQVLKHVHKFGAEDRRSLASVIATQVRSLHVHFQTPHLALRSDSFVFFLNPYRPDFSKPCIVDWACAPAATYRYPGYDAARPAWFYDAWALMMVLSEIAEWKPLDEAPGQASEVELQRWRAERIKMVCSESWKGRPTAKLFRFGFEFLSKRRVELEGMDRWEVKRFYDQLCDLFANWDMNTA